MISKATELRWALVLYGLLAGLFIVWPEIDLAASGLFFHDGHWLLSRDSAWLYLPYHGLPRLGQALLLALTLLFALGWLKRFPQLQARRTSIGFLLAAALLGQVLLVDAGLKEYSGRARPINIREFGGTKQFSPAFIPARQCDKNCAFVSGHVATAAFVMAFGWLGAPATRRRWLIASLACAGFFAMVRMLPGGHFLSDSIFAWFATYFSLWLTEFLFRKFGWLPAR